MAKYVLSHRRAGKFSSHEKVAAREAAATTFESLFAASADVVGAMRPKAETGREIIVFEASSTEVAAKQAEVGPDVLLEPEILHYPDITLPLDVGPGRTQAFAGEVLAGRGRTLGCT